MTEQKTKQNDGSVSKFLDRIPDEKRRKDCRALVTLMKQITRKQPKMWGPSIVGFGSHHYKYESGHEGDCFLTGFSPRKQNLTLYIMSGFGRDEQLMKKLGKFKTGKSCLYINALDDVDPTTLKKLVEQSVKDVSRKYK